MVQWLYCTHRRIAYYSRFENTLQAEEEEEARCKVVVVVIVIVVVVVVAEPGTEGLVDEQSDDQSVPGFAFDSVLASRRRRHMPVRRGM
jgi:hypothetical protein